MVTISRKNSHNQYMGDGTYKIVLNSNGWEITNGKKAPSLEEYIDSIKDIDLPAESTIISGENGEG